MKFDKDILIAIIICAVVLIGWDPLSKAMGWVPETPVSAVEQNAPAAEKAAPAVSAVPAGTAIVPPQKSAAAPIPAAAELPAVKLANDCMSYGILPTQGAVNAVTLLDYRNAERTGNVVLDQRLLKGSAGTLSVFSAAPGNIWQNGKVLSSQVSGSGMRLVREISDAAGQQFSLTQTWELEKDSYVCKIGVIFTNTTSSAITLRQVALSGGELGPWSISSGDKVRIPTHRMDCLTADGDFIDIKADKKDSKFFLKNPPKVKWVSLSNKYFAGILESANAFELYQKREFIADPADKDGDALPVISAGAMLGDIRLEPGEVRRFDFRYYSGPKIIANLDKFDPSTGKVMHLAWGPLDYLARLLLWILVKFHAVVGSYGWSIILLTLVVRLIFYPLTARGNASMRKMQLVQPQLKELKEKYKDNPQLMNTKMMELYRKEGVNPFGGCLPILLQIPVFFALYATLDGAVELRQVSFLWCHDLAAADTVARIPLYFFSLPVNPLVLAMTALMVVQQHMTPMAMDPVQKKMMALMPLVMLFMLYDLPSGLTLYWTVSNLFSIVQLQLQKRSREKAEKAAA